MHKIIENGKKYLPISIFVYIIIGSPMGDPILFFGEENRMIRNLNQMTFQGFGTILPEKGQPAKYMDKGVQILLRQEEAVVYRAVCDTWLNFGTGMTVLAVSLDGETYQSYYLDKLVCIKPGVLFSLYPFQGESAAYMAAKLEPEKVGSRNWDSLKVEHKVRVSGLYTFFYQEKEPGFLFSGEAHPLPELTYVDQGSLHSVADGQDQLLKQGDMVLYAPDQWHMQYSDMDVAPRFVTIIFDVDGDALEPLYNRKFTIPQKALQLLRKMLREQEQLDEFSNDMIIAQLNMLLLELLRDAKTPGGVKLQASNAVHSENEIIRKAQQYISTHIREKLSVPLVARQVDVSPSYLTALFHKNLQISPGEYIRRIKLQESKQMIRENNLNFTEIAAALQYSTVHHFSRQFKEKFGITPTEYAKSVR